MGMVTKGLREEFLEVFDFLGDAGVRLYEKYMIYLKIKLLAVLLNKK